MRKLMLAIALLPFFGAAASAQGPVFSVATLHNQTQDTIRGSFTNGAGVVTFFTIFPGQIETSFSENDPTDIFQVTFDPMVNVDGPLETVSIRTFKSVGPFGGRPHAFRQTPGNAVIFLIGL